MEEQSQNNLMAELELIKTKEIGDLKTALKTINAKIEKIAATQEQTLKVFEMAQPSPGNLLATLTMHSDSIGELTKALASAKAEGIKISSSGKGNRGTYEKIDDYVVSYEVALAENKLDLSFSPWITAEGEELMIGILKHESNEWIKCVIRVIFDEKVAETSGANQAWSAGRTYAKRNIYAALMGV